MSLWWSRSGVGGLFDSEFEIYPIWEVHEMLCYRYSACATVAAAVALSLLVGCPANLPVDDGTTDVGSPPGQGVDPSPVGENGNPGGTAAPVPGNTSGFVERWESNALTTHVPTHTREGVGLFMGDAGTWVLGDTASGSEDCAPSPHTAEIIMHRGSKAIRLTSNDSPCVDNMWIQFINEPIVDNNLDIPLSRSTQLSFYEEGALRDPELTSACGLYRCEITLEVEDTQGNLVIYILQNSPGPRRPTQFFSTAIPLDPDAGLHQRDLFDDFRLIPRFNPNGAKIRAVSLNIDNHGWAILDDLEITTDGTIDDSDDGTGPIPPPETLECLRLVTSLDDTYLRVDNKLDSHIEVHVSNLHMTVGPVINYSALIHENSCNRLGLEGFTTVDVTVKKCDSGDYNDFGSAVPCGFGFPRKTIQVIQPPGVTNTLEITESFFSN